MNEHRCRACNKLLFVGSFEGEIEAKCPRCHLSNVYQNLNAYTSSKAYYLTAAAVRT